MKRPEVAVGAVILDGGPPLRVVLARRARPPRQGHWSLPGGRVEAGETLAAALAREVKEETGLEVLVGPLVDVVEIIDQPHHFVVLDYLCRPTGGALSAGDDASEVAMAEVDHLGPYGLTESVAHVIHRAISLL